MKRPRPTFLERQAAKKAAAPAQPASLDLAHIANLCDAARRALNTYRGDDLVKMSVSLATCEAIVAAHAAKNAPPPAPSGPQPDAKPADAAPKPAAG